MGWVVNATLRPFYPREGDPVPILQEPGWVPGPVWNGVENFDLLGFDFRTVQPVAICHSFEAYINIIFAPRPIYPKCYFFSFYD
jgi:hypothetical protein